MEKMQRTPDPIEGGNNINEKSAPLENKQPTERRPFVMPRYPENGDAGVENLAKAYKDFLPLAEKYERAMYDASSVEEMKMINKILLVDDGRGGKVCFNEDLNPCELSSMNSFLDSLEHHVNSGQNINYFTMDGIHPAAVKRFKELHNIESYR